MKFDRRNRNIRLLTASFAVFFGVSAFSTSVFAQSNVSQTTDYIGGSGLTVTLNQPTESQGGRVVCGLEGDGCTPLNASRCNGTETRPIQVTLTTQNAIPANSRLYVWLIDSAGACEFEMPSDLEFEVAEQELGTGDPLVSGINYVYPNDFDVNTNLDTISGILNATNACSGDGIDDSLFRLCFGISVTATAGSSADDEMDTADGDIYGFVQFLVDTVAPDSPSTINVEPLDGRVSIRVEQGNSNTDDVRSWTTRYRQEQSDGAGCFTWTDFEEKTNDVDNQQIETFEVNLDNGVAYEMCVYGEDYAGNVGEPSEVFSVIPRDECDFIECYPGELKSGYCGSLPKNETFAFMLLCLVLFFTMRSSKRGRKSC